MTVTAVKPTTCPVCDLPVRMRTRHGGYGHTAPDVYAACLRIRDTDSR